VEGEEGGGDEYKRLKRRIECPAASPFCRIIDVQAPPLAGVARTSQSAAARSRGQPNDRIRFANVKEEKNQNAGLTDIAMVSGQAVAMLGVMDRRTYCLQ
jgi:hypothetical protein